MFVITSAQPAGETRTPTPAWSGLGFSCSMPEAVIRFVIMIVIRFSSVLGATSAILLSQWLHVLCYNFVSIALIQILLQGA